MDIKEIYIKNFRNIGEEGAEIKLSPITIFTGCNSAGKSTAAKALLLLETYLSDVKANNYNLIDTPLDFSKVVKLGTFDTVLNSVSKANGQENIVMGYSFNSIILSGDVHIRLTFGKKAQDFLHNGWLEELGIFIDSTELVSVKVVDRTYKIDIKSNNRFVEYVNCYKVRQILALWRKNSNILDKLKTEVIYENKISDLLQVEKNLLLNGIIKDRFWAKDIDKNIKSCELIDRVFS